MDKLDEFAHEVTSPYHKIKLAIAVFLVDIWIYYIIQDVYCVAPVACVVVFEMLAILFSTIVVIFLDYQDFKMKTDTYGR